MKLTPGAEYIKKRLNQMGIAHPSFHVVLGSGFKDALGNGVPATYQVKGEFAFHEVPGIHPSTAPGHSGRFVWLEHSISKKVGVIQVGRLHGYEGLDPKEVVMPLMYTRELGCEDYFMTNAAGGMDPSHQPGDVMVITDQINYTGKNPLVGENPKRLDGSEWGPRFIDLSNLFDKEWRNILKPALIAEKLNVSEGVYFGVLGPAFETPAEIRFFRQAGASSVGMSTVWETIAMKHTGARVCALSLISNIAAGLGGAVDGEHEELDHFAILDACKASSTGILKGILLSVERRVC